MAKAHLLAIFLTVLTLCPEARAADVPRLVWGDLKADDEATNEPKSWAVSESFDGMSVAIIFDRMVAQADGKDDTAAVTFKRHFSVVQPSTVSVQKFDAIIRGHISTTAKSSASLEVHVGNAERRFEWATGNPVSEDFTYTVTGNTTGGRLPDPFPIGADLAASRQSTSDAALLTIDSIDISVK